MPVQGWQLVKTFTAGCGKVEAMTSTGSFDAWATGEIGPCNGGLPVPLIANYDGFSWQRVFPPSHFGPLSSRGFTGAAVAALSNSYAWTFVQSCCAGFALLWNNGQWRINRLTQTSTTFTSAVVFSRSNVWAFGRDTVHNDGFAFHFNGRVWRQVPIPVMPIASAEPAPSRIWVVGTAKPGFRGQRTIAHWTGRSWRTIPLPNLQVSQGFTVQPRSIVGDGGNGVWVSGVLSDGYPPDSAGFLLHWTGSVWVDIDTPFQSQGLEPLAHDGNGGLWMGLSANCGGRCQYRQMANRDGSGNWLLTTLPVQYVDVSAMRWVPGTANVWAGGSAGRQSENAVILEYQP
jgi:hypothetical protein